MKDPHLPFSREIFSFLPLLDVSVGFFFQFGFYQFVNVALRKIVKIISFRNVYESILKQLHFDTAKIQLETEILGTYNFFWKSKRNSTVKENFDEKDKMIETELWFFGFGNRDRWGLLESELLPSEIFKIDHFKYPVED